MFDPAEAYLRGERGEARGVPGVCQGLRRQQVQRLPGIDMRLQQELDPGPGSAASPGQLDLGPFDTVQPPRLGGQYTLQGPPAQQRPFTVAGVDEHLREPAAAAVRPTATTG